jgi:phage baseplate assembly protein W
MSSIGIKLPITYNTGDGFTMIKTIKQMVKQNLKMLILTNPGERVMEPNFGVGIMQYLFSNYSDGVGGQIKNKIEEQVRLYLPVVKIGNIQFEESPDTNSIRVILTYQIPDIAVNDLLEFTI